MRSQLLLVCGIALLSASSLSAQQKIAPKQILPKEFRAGPDELQLQVADLVLERGRAAQGTIANTQLTEKRSTFSWGSTTTQAALTKFLLACWEPG